MAKKGQYAATMIVIGMLVLFVVYVLLAYPEEKARTLNIPLPNKTNISTSPLGEGTTLIFSSGEISEVGHSSGETVFNFNLGNVYVAYPTKEKVLSEQNTTLKTNIFKKDSILLSANNLNLDNTKEVVIKLNTTYLSGTPNIIVYLNGTKVFERQLTQTGELNVIIPKNYLDVNNPLKIELTHNGAFWTSQEMKINVKVVQVYYYPEKPSMEKILTLGQTNIKGNEVRISFTPQNVKTDGGLIVKINDKVIFSGTVEGGKEFTLSERLEDSGIKVGDNIITFETDKGGVYNLTNASIKFVAVSTPATSKVYSFDIPKEYLSDNSSIILGLRVDKIIKPGYITAKVNNGPVYYFENTDLASGAWVYTTINKTYLKNLSNLVVVDSPDGRYRVTGFAIIAE